MSSTNKTQNIQLNQWVSSDPVLMADFNADNQKLDTAMAAANSSISSLNSSVSALQSAVTALQSVASAAGRCFVASGSYVGNGSAGSGNPTQVSVGFVPDVILISCGSGFSPGVTASNGYYPKVVACAIRGMEYGFFTLAVNSQTTHITWSNTGVSWWVDTTYVGTDATGMQLNENGATYYYVVIGHKA